MAEQHEQSATGPAAELADQVRARVAANAQQVQRTRQRVTQAMIQVRQVDHRLRGEVVDDPQWVGAVEHATEVMWSESAHPQAVEPHEQTVELRVEQGWPVRAAAARAYSASARERSRRAREKLARHQERAAAAGERVRQARG